MYNAFELELVAEYDGHDGCTYCEPYFQKGDYPENVNDPDFLESINVLRLYWTIYGRKPDGMAEALIDSDNYEHLKKQYDFLCSLLESYKKQVTEENNHAEQIMWVHSPTL